MERLRLDYQRRESPIPRQGLLVLLLALITAGVLGDYYLNLSDSIREWETYADQMDNTAHRRGLALKREARGGSDYGEEIHRANVVLRQLTLPWDQLFESIESVGSKDVALLSLAPDPERRLVRIGIEAKNPAAGLDYLRKLEGQEIFQNLQLQSHQIQIQDPEKPIRFTLQTNWRVLP